MISNIDLDIPKNKAKETKVMVYRSHQRLKQQLKSIDTEHSKSLSSINRDLKIAKDALRAFRVSQEQSRRQSIGPHSANGPHSDFGLKLMTNTSTAPLRKRGTVLFERNSYSNSPGRFSEVSEAFTNVTI